MCRGMGGRDGGVRTPPGICMCFRISLSLTFQISLSLTGSVSLSPRSSLRTPTSARWPGRHRRVSQLCSGQPYGRQRRPMPPNQPGPPGDVMDPMEDGQKNTRFGLLIGIYTWVTEDSFAMKSFFLPRPPPPLGALDLTHLEALHGRQEVLVIGDKPVRLRLDRRPPHHAPIANKEVGAPGDLHRLEVGDAVADHDDRRVRALLTDHRNGLRAAMEREPGSRMRY